MMVRNHLEFVRSDSAGKVCNLRRVKIVSRCQSFNSEIEERARSECIRRIQTEVANEHRNTLLLSVGPTHASFGEHQGVQQPGGANNDVTVQSKKKADNALLVWFENTGAGNAGPNTRRLHTFNSRT